MDEVFFLSYDFIKNILRWENLSFLRWEEIKHKHNKTYEINKMHAIELNHIQMYTDKANMREDNNTWS